MYPLGFFFYKQDHITQRQSFNPSFLNWMSLYGFFFFFLSWLHWLEPLVQCRIELWVEKTFPVSSLRWKAFSHSNLSMLLTVCFPHRSFILLKKLMEFTGVNLQDLLWLSLSLALLVKFLASLLVCCWIKCVLQPQLC